MSLNKFLKGLKTAPKFIKGILSVRKKALRLSFVFEPKDNLWYIDMPWPGDRYNLAMVAGSNKLLDFLCEEEDNNYVTVDVLPRRFHSQHLDLPCYPMCARSLSKVYLYKESCVGKQKRGNG